MTNEIIGGSNWKERFITTSRYKLGSKRQRLPEKINRKLEGSMKILNEVTYEHKYLEKDDAQGSSRRTRTSVECPRKTTFT